MKKLILSIITVLCISQVVYSKSPTPFVKFEAGPSLNIPNVYFVEGIFGVKIKFWEFESQSYGGWLSWMEHDSNQNFKPFMDIYSLNQKFSYKKVFLHYKHYCAHPVTFGTEYYHTQEGTQKQKFKATPYWWGGNMTTLSIGFEYEFK